MHSSLACLIVIRIEYFQNFQKVSRHTWASLAAHCCAAAHSLRITALGQGFSNFFWPCTPSAFRQMSMYPQKFLMTKRLSKMTKTHWIFDRTSSKFPLNLINIFTNILSCLITDIFTISISDFCNNIYWYMYKYLEINNKSLYIPFYCYL